MSNSIVRLGTLEKALNYLGLPKEEWMKRCSLSPDAESVRIPAASVIVASGKTAGEEDTVIDGTSIKANQHVIFQAPPIKLSPAARYTVLCSINPELLRFGTAYAPTFIGAREIREEGTIVCRFHAHRAVDLTQIPWILKLALLD